jgi:conjugative transfer region lipoprotein (TIGR03751 family)
MIDIYREAMDEAAAPVVATFDPQTLCASLELEDGTEVCQETLAAHVLAVYRQIDSEPVEQPLDYIEYTRTTRSELDNLFPRLENPDLVIYVYPHLATRTRAPIPGYTTVVPLYERVEYRLPGEALLTTPAPAEAPVNLQGEEGAQ